MILLFAILQAAGSPGAAQPLACPDPAAVSFQTYNDMQSRLKADLSTAFAAHPDDAGKRTAALDGVVACYQPAFTAFEAKFPKIRVKDYPTIFREQIERNGDLVSPAPPPPRG